MTAGRRVPLSVLDLIPVTSGQQVPEAVGNAIDLARQTEAYGYRRFWIAEHHVNPGVAGSAPIVAIALIAAATTTIRVGSGAVLAGHYTALGVVEQFGLIDAVHPGRLDLGLGRSASRKPGAPVPGGSPAPTSPPSPPATAPNGLPLPAAPKDLFARLAESPRFRAQAELFGRRDHQEYGDQVADLLSLLDGNYRSADGIALHAIPGEGAELEIWILGSSGGESAQLAGARGLPFAANYHVAPQRVLEAVEGYRAAFRPSPRLEQPQVAVSADVVVAETEERAAELASGYRHWVRSIRSGEGAIRFPSPAEAAVLPWTDHDQELVADRLQTQFVGTPEQVVAGLDRLAEATAADELIITTITHRHADRVRSYRLLAEAWNHH